MLRVPIYGLHPPNFRRHPLHKAANNKSCKSIVPPHGEVSDVLTALLPHRIIDHTSIKMCVIIAVEMVTIYIANYMIQCGQTATTQVSDFLPENGGAGELSILVFCFRTLVLIIQTPNSNLELTKLKLQFVF